MSLMKKVKIASLVVLGLLVTLIIVAIVAGPPPTAKESADKPEVPHEAIPPAPTSLKEIASRMTKTSPTFQIPWPDDAVRPKDDVRAVITRIGTVPEITAFYKEWMASRGWTFD